MDDERVYTASIENDEWRSVREADERISYFQGVARATSLKDQRMNIRIAKRDLDGLKERALEEGIPYQTLVSSILHKYVTGRLREVVER